MSALGNLVRISRWHLDEKRQTLAELERQVERLDGELATLDRELEAERRLAERDDTARRAFPAYAARQRKRRESLQQRREALQAEVEAAREDLRAAFREAKTYELARDAETDRARQARTRAEDAAMDELGLQLHRRKTSPTR
jgi:flagellar export protein FliJ